MEHTLKADLFFEVLQRPEETVHDFILKKSKEISSEFPEEKFVTNAISGEVIKVADLEPKSRSIASALTKLGFKYQDAMIYVSDNVTKIHLVFLGIWRLGGSVRSSYPEDTEDTLISRITESKARWVLCDENLVPKYKNAIRSVNWPVHLLCFDEKEGCLSVDDLLNDNGEAFVPSSLIQPSDACLILCTSGTTGKSKGAVHTHSSMLSLFEVTEFATTGKNRILPKNVLMLGRTVHLSGSLHIWRTLISRVEMFLLHKKTPETILKAVETYRPEVVFGMPKFLEYLVEGDADKYDTSSIKMIIARSCFLQSLFIRKMFHLPGLNFIHSGYGLTENPSVTTTFDFTSSGQLQEIKGLPQVSIGKLSPNTELRILDPDTNEILGVGKVGEIVVKSPYNIKEYWDLPKATEELFVDGFLRTGDLGYYDSHGFVYFQDRLKETFKYNGLHISPSEIEGAINEHPAVRDSCVFGVNDPDGGGSIPAACVILKKEFKNSCSSEEIRTFAESKLAPYKHFRGGFHIVETFPVGKTGKVSRKTIAEAYEK